MLCRAQKYLVIVVPHLKTMTWIPNNHGAMKRRYFGHFFLYDRSVIVGAFWNTFKALCDLTDRPTRPTDYVEASCVMSYLNCSLTIDRPEAGGCPTSEVREVVMRTPAADIFLAAVVVPLDDEEDLESPSELLARTGLCKLVTASGLTMILMEDR